MDLSVIFNELKIKNKNPASAIGGDWFGGEGSFFSSISKKPFNKRMGLKI